MNQERNQRSLEKHWDINHNVFLCNQMFKNKIFVLLCKPRLSTECQAEEGWHVVNEAFVSESRSTDY